ncbi:glycosyltransferase family 2 protein [Ligilactobacillus equi]
MLKECRVSVVMASYNGEKYIKSQIISVLKNLKKYDELIISDDGSTDKTISIINKINDSRVKLVEGPKKGVKKNFENALLNCSGKYIFLCDQDDIWFDKKVETILPFLDEHDMVIHDNIVMDSNLTKVIANSFMERINSKTGVFNNIVKNTYIGCCMAITRRLLDIVLPIPNKIEMHDQWIGILNDMYYKNTLLVKTPLMYYRRHEENVSSFKHYPLLKMIRNRIVLCFFIAKKRWLDR